MNLCAGLVWHFMEKELISFSVGIGPHLTPCRDAAVSCKLVPYPKLKVLGP